MNLIPGLPGTLLTTPYSILSSLILKLQGEQQSSDRQGQQKEWSHITRKDFQRGGREVTHFGGQSVVIIGLPTLMGSPC